MSPSSPNIAKKEGRFKKFRRNTNKLSSIGHNTETNLMKQKSVSTSALIHLKEQPFNSSFADLSKRRNSVSMPRTPSSFSEDSQSTNSEEVQEPNQPKNQISVKELIEKMILHLQVLERKNELLTLDLQQMSEEKMSLESELSSTKVELNLYKNRLNQIEKICDEWHCSICMDNKLKIVTTKRAIVATLCGHLFCSLCAQTFMSSNRQTKHCPVCHKPLKEGQLNYHPIFMWPESQTADKQTMNRFGIDCHYFNYN